MMRHALVCLTLAAVGCGDNIPRDNHGPIAPGISAPLGEPIPSATPEQLATFERGKEVANRRFALGDGLGPVFNVTFCTACHEKPATGGSAGLYRNFALVGQQLDGPFFPSNLVQLFDCGDLETPPAERQQNPPPESVDGALNGVLRIYGYDQNTSRPDPGTLINIAAGRNPIPFFGVGLLAEIPEAEIRKREDPDDEDGDGISGRVNLEMGFVGRFGRKAQTASIEGFIRGPLFNHLGVTSDPLTDEQRSRLPVDSSEDALARQAMMWLGDSLAERAQAAAPGTPNCDLDDIPDPEMSPDDLFDLISFSMLLAAPRLEPLDDETRRGLQLFDKAGCDRCHAPRLESPRGPLPVYSDLLLHDMGPDLADFIVQSEASGSEFRTQPLWGIAAVGPYLHDGRAGTIEEAILLHGGEARASRDRFDAYDVDQRAAVVEFLLSLGGRDQASGGLIPPSSAAPADGDYGGPMAGINGTDRRAFEAGRLAFDREFRFADGVGAPRFNGDSCRACHFEPAIGGAGPRGVNVMRHGILDGGTFTAPEVGTILHRVSSEVTTVNFPEDGITVFEHRQTPSLLGLGLLDALPDSAITANADPDDGDNNGISGRVSMTSDGRVGRFGWKAQVPSLAEFTRDAAGAELGMTMEAQAGLTFGAETDGDAVADPELDLETAGQILEFMQLLAPPPRRAPADPTAAAQGEGLFATVGCDGCHIPALQGADGPVQAYTDMLLHEILPAGSDGIEDTAASVLEFRTAPLWGISTTAPYMHSGEADTLDEAIRLHDGEAAAIRDAYIALTADERAALVAFLETL